MYQMEYKFQLINCERRLRILVLPGFLHVIVYRNSNETENENPKKLQNFVKYVIVKFTYNFVADCL